ncbi:2179_t:CDS:2 [Entrophospora sp. SA101]|nr:2179_t:CDS:2 [Entrophospora sp. SA101]
MKETDLTQKSQMAATSQSKHNNTNEQSTPSLLIEPAPAPAMYWTKIKTNGKIPKALRGHTVNLVGELMYVFGGRDLLIGEAPPPCRAHSSTLVDKKLFIFGGGDGSVYFNHLYIFDTDTLSWSKPETTGDIPLPRRAHTTAYYNNSIYVFGGGDGARALNDVHMLNVSDLNNLVWKKVEPSGRAPISRGYHTSNLVGSKLVVYGGSDGLECFSDVHILDLEKNKWIQVHSEKFYKRLSHTSTRVGSYLFIICGHNGTQYSSDLLLLNLVYGTRPTERGYHSSVLYDSRLFVFGGYDGQTVYDDLYVLDLSACAYLPQIINFELPEIYNK